MTKEKLLELIRKDRPSQIINEVIDFEKLNDGSYVVLVDMEGKFFETTIKHIKTKLPYPLFNYNGMSEKDKRNWLDAHR